MPRGMACFRYPSCAGFGWHFPSAAVARWEAHESDGQLPNSDCSHGHLTEPCHMACVAERLEKNWALDA